jgi:nucleotide-binding universal stress UspA family protein
MDGSELARQALPLATELALQAHAELIVLTALTPPISEIPSTALFLRDDDALAAARDQLPE